MPPESQLRKEPWEFLLTSDSLGDCIGEAEIEADVSWPSTAKKPVVIGILATQAKTRDVTLDTALTPHPVITEGDRVHLEPVILNLVANAIDAVTTARSDTRRITVRTLLIADDTVELSFSETGPRHSTDVLKQVFEPFFTNKKSGMGMGPAISHDCRSP